MRDSKLYIALKSFNRYEQNRFRKYLQSPFFNKDTRIVELFNLLCQDINGTFKGKFEPSQLWSRMGCEGTMKDARWRKYVSDLLRLCMDYLAYKNYESKPMQRAQNLMEAVERRKIKPLFKYSIKQGARAKEDSITESPQFYLNDYLIELFNYELTESELQRGQKSNLEKISNSLDIFYIAEKFRIGSLAKTQEGVMKVKYNIGFLDTLNRSSLIKASSYPAIKIYHAIYNTASEEQNDEAYFELKTQLLLNRDGFLKKDLWDAYKSGLNYCGRKIKLGDKNFIKEFFDLFQEIDEQKLYLADGELSPWLFKNAITIALRLKKYDWVEEFITRSREHLPISFRDNAVTFNLAKIAWYKKDWDKVIELLRYVEYEDFSYNLNSKMFLLLTYFDTHEIELFESTVDSFQTYLRRHKKNLAKNTQEHYLNFTKLISKLHKSRYDKTKVDKFAFELGHTKNTAARNWFHEKIAELRGEKIGTET